MKNPRIYQNIDIDINDEIELEQKAAHHLSRVLRLKNENPITLFNGNGNEYSATLSLQGKKVFAHIHQAVECDRESNLNIALLQGISKGDRMDMCIQKAVELGVNTITPVICQRTVVNLKGERGDKKLRHWQGIIISACEQSGRNVLPQLLDPVLLTDAFVLNDDSLKLTLDPNAKQDLKSFSPRSNKITFLTGPEGGLTQQEVEMSLQNDFNAAHLGKRILRTETASIAAISAVQTLWGDFTNL